MEPQLTVVTQLKDNALFLTLWLKEGYDLRLCFKGIKNIPKVVNDLSQTHETEILYGIGFGQQLSFKLGIQEEFIYKERSYNGQRMSATAGDIFIHAKSNSISSMFEMSKDVLDCFCGIVEKFEDVYGFKYRKNRDLSGFIDGINNPDSHLDRINIGVRPDGSSFCLTQRWEHDFEVICPQNDLLMEQWVGRTKESGDELKDKALTSHVAKMKGGNAFQQKPRFRIVRQSMPYGQMCNKAGLFFIAYSKAVEPFDFMLDQLVGSAGEDQPDDILKLSKPVTGNYWFFPSAQRMEILFLEH
ncbi:hypothetical protein ACOME3_005785 [Neoechinorhynchus agilis]